MKFLIVCPTINELHQAERDHSYPAIDSLVGELEARNEEVGRSLLFLAIKAGKYGRGAGLFPAGLGLTINVPTFIILKEKTNASTTSSAYKEGGKFISLFKLGEDPTLNADGQETYVVCGYAESIIEAHQYLYGKKKHYNIIPREEAPCSIV